MTGKGQHIPNNSQKAKMYLIFVLLIVLVVVIYFRFFRKRAGYAAYPAGSQVAVAPLEVPQLHIPDLKTVRSSPSPVSGPTAALLRDIFTPSQSPLINELIKPHAGQPSRQAATLKLKGTIVGGDKAIAVINDQFVKTGDWLGEYRVVKIGKQEVVLNRGSQKMKLTILEK